MMIVSSSGYIISVLGPYLADSKNSDAKILSHMIQTNVEDIRKWVEEDDIFIVDRGFRDAEALLDDLGIHVEMPSFLTRHSKQHSTEEANTTRFVTKMGCRVSEWQTQDMELFEQDHPQYTDTTYWRLCPHSKCNLQQV